MERLLCYSMVVLPRETIRPWLIKVALEQQASPQGVKEAELHELARNASIYMVPPFADFKQFEDFLEQNYDDIFKTEFCIWTQNESLWPTQRSYAMFKEWFDFEMHVDTLAGFSFEDLSEKDNLMGLLLNPKQSCIDWVNENINKINRSYFGDLDITRATGRRVSPAFTIKRIEREAAGVNQFIQQNYNKMFDFVLTNFSKDKSIWPKEKDIETFNSWFDVDIHRYLFDLTGAVKKD